jgi:hypothetical protein
MVGIPPHKNVTSVRFVIDDIYDGSKWAYDIAVSEVKFRGYY